MSATDRARGVVAAGHPLTAEAGAEVLREGGNAVDAAVCSVITSFALETALTGLGAGGYMLIQGPGREPELIDFFVAAPGLGGVERTEELKPMPVAFDEVTTQVFNVGAASCGVPGTAAGLARALERFGTASVADLVGPGIGYARDGAPLNRQQAYVLRILEPIYTLTREGREIYAPGGRLLEEGDELRWPELADALELFAAEGPAPFYEGEVAARLAAFVQEHGGTLSTQDLAAYEPASRRPVAARFNGHEVLTNPPPSSGGILIAYCLELLERTGASGTAEIAKAMEMAEEARHEGFVTGLTEDGFEREFLEPAALDAAVAASDRLGSTTHLVAIDREGLCASVTCSNGTGSGMIVPGTGVHLNNMLGEEDLNPLGFHRARPGSRIPSMMSPTVAQRDGEVVAGLGSAGSNRIRSAILQTTVNLLSRGMSPQEAIDAPRIHFERGALQAEPGTDPEALDAIAAAGVEVVRWGERNLFFGGVQAVTRDPATGLLDAAGDPRRGGAVAYA